MMEKLYDINKDNYSVRCKVYCHDLHGLEKAIICSHGFGGYKDNKVIERFAGQVTSKYKKTAVIAFDLPCHGKDARKKLVLSECDQYISLVNEDARERFGVKELYGYGTSFGAFLMMIHMLEHGNPYHKIALRCPAINFYDSLLNHSLSEEDRKKIDKGKEVLVGRERKIKISKEFLQEIKEVDLFSRDFIDYAEDMLIVHGTKDEFVPYEISYEFADRNIIELLTVEGADHRFRDIKMLDQISNDIMDFFELNL